MARHRTRNCQRGVTLLLTLLALLLISVVGAAILYMAAAETGFVGSQRASARSFFSSLSGMEEMRYRMVPVIVDAQGGLNSPDTQAFAKLPAIPPPGVNPQDVLYLVNRSNPVAPANFNAIGSQPGANPAQPTSATNDSTRTIEVPSGVNIRAVASDQPGAGLATGVPWNWVRINLKTELAAREDLNLDKVLDQVPVFLYFGRQYRAADLLAMTNGALVLPPPWGPDPLLQVPPILDRPCVAPVCASPVYMLTGLANLPGFQTGSRLVRMEVASNPPFSLNAGLFSEPGVTVNGAFNASGRDICDPNCAATTGGIKNIFANQANWDSRDTSTVPANCRYVIPVKSKAPPGSQSLPSASALSDPTCDPTKDANCVCQTTVSVVKGVKTTKILDCVLANQPPPMDVNQVIDTLRPLARVLHTPVSDYYPQVGTSNLSCDATGCQGQQVELGGFPFVDPANPAAGADPVNGTRADPVITYVPGDFKCTSACSGAGILIVDGNLELNATMVFYGIIVVRGNISVLGVGNPPTPCNIYGAVITNKGIDTTLGGKICFQYNTCAMRNTTAAAPLLSLAFREVPQ